MGTPLRKHLALIPALALVPVLGPAALPAQIMGGIGSAGVISNGSAGSGAAVPLNLPDEDVPSTTDRIDGVVVSSLDSKPVPRVLVTTADRRFGALTDYEGRFSFDLRRPVPQPGEQTNPGIGFVNAGFAQQNSTPVQFQLRKPGYTSASAMVYFPATRSDAPQPPIQLTIQPAASLIGRVDADSGDPPANPLIGVYRKNVQNGSASWNQIAGSARLPNGEFRSADLSPGDYKLSASAISSAGSRPNAPDAVTDLLPAYNSGAATLDAAPAIHIGPGETATVDLTLRHARFYRVAVPIAGDTGAQIPRVILSPAVPGRNLSFNARDRSIEGYLPNGEYDVHLISQTQNPGRPPNQNQAQNQDAACATIHLSVADAPVQAKPIALHSAMEVPVEITRDYPYDPTELNRGGFFFNFQPVDPASGGFAVVNNGNNHGTDTIARACAGAYRFVFNSGEGYAASINSGGVDLLQQPLVIDDNVAPQPIFVTLRNDFASLNIRIASATPAATPASIDPVYAFAIPLDRLESQNFGPVGVFNGNASLSSRYAYPFRLNPGHYLVLASSDPQLLNQLEYRNPDVLRDLASQGVTVNLTAGEKSDIEVPLMSSSPSTSNQVITATQ